LSHKVLDSEGLKAEALETRKEILRILHRAGSGHPGGSLSAVEILLALYSYKMRHDPANPSWEDRDRLIVSKGHISAGVYVTLARQGYFPKDELDGYRTFGSRLQGHVYTGVPGVEFNTGSLGHGLSVANGIALGARLHRKDVNAYCLLGDGELQEGSIWEAAMTAAHYKLDNVCAIVDYNKVQENGPTNEIKNLEPLADKWRSFGWHAVEVLGHNFKQLAGALDTFGTVTDKPFVIIAHTIKGKGISFMEANSNWHGKTPNADQFKEAMGELEVRPSLL
jgi:transketolase